MEAGENLRLNVRLGSLRDRAPSPIDHLNLVSGMCQVFTKAVEEGFISAEDDLLRPRFYLAKGLEDWLLETVKSWMADRPNWVN